MSEISSTMPLYHVSWWPPPPLERDRHGAVLWRRPRRLETNVIHFFLVIVHWAHGLARLSGRIWYDPANTLRGGGGDPPLCYSAAAAAASAIATSTSVSENVGALPRSA
jgi:hypothetical protein